MQLDAELAAIIQPYGFDPAQWEILRHRLRSQGYSPALNVIDGPIRAAQPGDIHPVPSEGTLERLRLECLGAAAIAKGEVAVLVLAGGMATRFGGAVKGLVPVHHHLHFAELKRRSVLHVAHQFQRAMPMWWMSSFLTHGPLTAWADAHEDERVPLSLFSQSTSLRLTEHGELYRGSDPQDSVYCPGHGDTLTSLKRTSLPQEFKARGGRYIFMSNVDNLAATLDPFIVGAHIDGGKRITVELVDKQPNDQGGAPAWFNDTLQIIEAFRFPPTFDQTSIPVFNTNTFVFDVEVLQDAYPLDWFAVKKTANDSAVIQYEQLFGQLTAFIPGHYIRVEREGRQSRFIPVKTPEDLEAQRPLICEVLQARGVSIEAG
ncbi:MAG: UTP--glucose-1-phosphate uridylyltransferase [Myxococcales bacterium]|nr:UTP--glucose-1-phosphate uridylyltransferase [Myxococcales bacterium]